MTKVAERGGGVRTFLEKFPRLQNENMLVLTNLNLMKGWSNIVCGFFIITSIWTENEHSYVFFLTISGGQFFFLHWEGESGSTRFQFLHEK